MTWFKVDDTLAAHTKPRKAGLPAMGLWVLSGAYASQQLTDGFVPAWYVEGFPSGRKHAAALVTAGLWTESERDDEPGWQFHDWDQANPTREEVQRKRDQARERMRSVREKFAPSSREQTANVREKFASSDANPDPTRPDPTTQPSVVTPSAKHTIPEDWHPTAEDQVWAAAECPSVNVSRETASFVDYFLDKGEKRPGWTRSWKRWMREAQERAEKRAPLRAVSGDRALTVEQMRGRRM